MSTPGASGKRHGGAALPSSHDPVELFDWLVARAEARVRMQVRAWAQCARWDDKRSVRTALKHGARARMLKRLGQWAGAMYEQGHTLRMIAKRMGCEESDARELVQLARVPLRDGDHSAATGCSSR